MSKKKDSRNIIIEKYFNKIKYITNKNERIAFLKQMAKESQCKDQKDLELLSEGYQHALNNEFVPAIDKFNELLAINRDNALAWNGLGIAYRNNNDSGNARDAYLKAIELDEKNSMPWNGLGNVYRTQKDYEKAKEAYLKAIELDEKYSMPWNNLGVVYSDQKDYEKAKEAYLKAIELDEKNSLPWNNLGNEYLHQKDYEKAKEYYLKAIELDEKNSMPWNGLGNVYRTQKDYEKAKESYLKAIEIDDKIAHAHRNLALCLMEFNLEGARIYLEKALELFKLEKEKYWVSVTENNLETVLEKIREQTILKATAAMENNQDPLKFILSKTRSFEEEIYNNQTSFQAFVEKNVSKEKSDDYLKVLRRWNSYTPIVADNYHISKGGGYFLKFNGNGIVIDPGFNFIDNFKGAGHSFDEIDIVMITHAHNDHTSDLESILTLLNNYNKKQKGLDDFESDNTIRADIAKAKECNIKDVTPDEIEREFLDGSARRKTLDIYVTQSVEKKFSGMFTLRKKEDYNCHSIEKGDVKQLLDGSLQVSVIGAKHDDIISDRDSVGFVFDFDDTVLVYTGDTGWDEMIENQYKKVKSEHQGKHIILLAHFGGFKEYENKYVTDGDKAAVYYKDHLGRLGLARLVQTLKPEICFISEFGEELRRHREELAEIYERVFGECTRFLPADIGLEYHIQERKIKAITKLDLEKNDCVSELTEPSDVMTCLLRKDYSLHYYDKKAPFKASDLIQVLIEKYDRSAL